MSQARTKIARNTASVDVTTDSSRIAQEHKDNIDSTHSLTTISSTREKPVELSRGINTQKKTITSLVFEGGGILGLSYIGALCEFEKIQKINDCKNFGGSSIGSLFAALLAARASTTFLSNEFEKLNLQNILSGSLNTQNLNIVTLLATYGSSDGDLLFRIIESLLFKLTGIRRITFTQLCVKYGTKLVVTGTNVSRGKLKYFSYEETPSLAVSSAVRISCSFPFVFAPVTYENELYVDGGIADNYPIRVFDTLPGNNTLGFKVDKADEIEQKTLSTDNIFNFTKSLIETISRAKSYLTPADFARTVRINCGNIESMNLLIGADQRKFLITQGEKAVKIWAGNSSVYSR